MFNTSYKNILLEMTMYILSKRTAAGLLAMSFALVGCSTHTDDTPAYCYQDNGQTVLSGRLDEDRGLYIAHYKAANDTGPQTLVGYKESKVSMKQNNQEVRALCSRIARGENTNLPSPQRP